MQHFGLLISALFWAVTATAHSRIEIPDAILPLLDPSLYQIPKDPGSGVVADILNERVMPGGKRIRPYLCFLSAGLVNPDPKAVDWIACVAEETHQASLTHDDVIDGSETRRGNPSLPAVIENKKSVLTGNYLLAHLTKSAVRHGNDRLTLGILEVIQGMTIGEFEQADLLASGTYTPMQWAQVARKKTGLLFGWSLSAPAIWLGQNEGFIDTMSNLGNLLGEVFQLRDDMDDADLERGELNYVLMLAAGETKSPLDPDFSEEEIRNARQRVIPLLETQRKRMESLIENLMRYSATVRGGEAHRLACRDGLLNLANLLTRLPD